jgi:protein-tyrosine phosphatase
VIDLHSHILPGLDDGVRSVADARELARTSLAGGVRAIVATPHVRDDYPTTAGRMETSVTALQRDLEEHEIALPVLPGGELALDRVEALTPDELARFTLAQSGRYVLVEFPYYSLPLGLEGVVRRLRAAGVVAILAHPERNPGIQESPEWLERPVAAGALVQLTFSSLAGGFGRGARRAATRLVERRFAHVIASDAHSAGAALDRKQVLKTVRDRGLARYLTVDVPAAVIAGDDLA